MLHWARYTPGLVVGLALAACRGQPMLPGSSLTSTAWVQTTDSPIDGTATSLPAPFPTAALYPTSAADPTATQEIAIINDTLAQVGVIVESDGSLSPSMLVPIFAAAQAYDMRLEELVRAMPADGAELYWPVRGLPGPTVIYVYPEQATVDGVHPGLNCGWEGRQEPGCLLASIHPAQTFPEQAWLILLAGEALASPGEIQAVHLAAHELAHNLTWGEGPYEGGGAFDYAFYAGDLHFMAHAGAFGVQVGRYAYESEAARAAYRYWRQELTADAIASWALDDLQGPHSESVGGYLTDFMLCVMQNRPDC